MSDFDVKDSIQKAIALMQRKLDDFEQQDEIQNSDIWPLTQIAKTLAVIDKQSKEHPEETEDFTDLTHEEIDVLAKETVEKLKKEIK
jgi:hypothetical protein